MFANVFNNKLNEFAINNNNKDDKDINIKL